MAAEVYISYSPRDSAIAGVIRSSLEAEGILCRFPGETVLPTDNPDTVDEEAICAARVMVLVFTDSANNSEKVLRDVGTAVGAGVTLVPYKLTASLPSRGMQYYLSTVHWLDAVSIPPEKRMSLLTRR